MKRWCALVSVLGLALESTAASADPVMLVCVSANPPAAKGLTYQVVFDEAKQTVQLDRQAARKAKISATAIEFIESGQMGNSYRWIIDRLTGADRIELVNPLFHARTNLRPSCSMSRNFPPSM